MDTVREVVWVANESMIFEAEKAGDMSVAVRAYEVDLEGWEKQPDGRVNSQFLYNAKDVMYGVERDKMDVSGNQVHVFWRQDLAEDLIKSRLRAHYEMPANPSFFS